MTAASNDPGYDPEKAADDAMERLQATPEGRANVERLGSKDVALKQFQHAHGVSDRTAEAAIKEWISNHAGNFDWDPDEVKEICLRNERLGVPHAFLPEDEK